MEKKISVEKFVNGVANLKGKDDLIENYIKEHICDEYVPYVDKCNTIMRIINASCYEIAGTEKPVRIFKQNTPARFMLYNLTLVDLYTDIEIDYQNSAQEFDRLCQYDLVNRMLEFMPEFEVEMFSSLLNMYLEDIYENERNFTSKIENFIEEAKELFKAVITPEMIEMFVNSIEEK